MRNLRPALALFLAAQLFVTDLLLAAPLAPASNLNRSEFVAQTEKMATLDEMETSLLIGREESMWRILGSVEAKFARSSYSARFAFADFSSYVQGWTNFLDLARLGYSEAAMAALRKSIIRLMIELNPQIRRFVARDVSDVQKVMAEIAVWTVDAYQTEYGFIHRREVDRMYLALRAAAKQVDDRGIHDGVRKHFYEQKENGNLYPVLGGIGALVGLVAGPALVIENIELLASVLQGWELAGLGILIAAIVGSAVAGFNVGVKVVEGAAQLHAAIQKKTGSNQLLSERCEGMLTPSGEIIPISSEGRP